MIRYAALALGVLVVSTAALLIRHATAEGAGSLAVAAGRLTLAALVVVPIALVTRGRELRSLGARDWAVATVAGAFVAVHFATWIASLAYTSVASSVALVTTNPIWVGLASWLVLRAAPSRRTVAGIAISITGSLLILAADLVAGPGPDEGGAAQASAAGTAPLLGNLLALSGAVAISAYFLIGAGINRRLSLLAYVAIVYGSAALVMNLIALAAGQGPETVPDAAWLPIALLALGPQLAGHTLINASLRHLSPTFVSLAILGEPVGAALLAWMLLGEGFRPLQLAGFATLLAGIALAARGEPAPPAAAARDGGGKRL